jgi:hypothetical protein
VQLITQQKKSARPRYRSEFYVCCTFTLLQQPQKPPQGPAGKATASCCHSEELPVTCSRPSKCQAAGCHPGYRNRRGTFHTIHGKPSAVLHQLPCHNGSEGRTLPCCASRKSRDLQEHQNLTSKTQLSTTQKSSLAGTRTRVLRVRAVYPNQLDYEGSVQRYAYLNYINMLILMGTCWHAAVSSACLNSFNLDR